MIADEHPMLLQHMLHMSQWMQLEMFVNEIYLYNNIQTLLFSNITASLKFNFHMLILRHIVIQIMS